VVGGPPEEPKADDVATTNPTADDRGAAATAEPTPEAGSGQSDAEKHITN